MSTDDTDLEEALRSWGDQHRRRASRMATPAITDLLAERRRRHGIAAVAASVVLVAVLGVGLGLGLPGRGRTASPAGPNRHTHSFVATGNRPCWQQFTDAGSRFRGFSGIVVLRYTGTTTCRVFERPQLALAHGAATLIGPHRPPATLDSELAVEPGDTVRFGVRIAPVCVTSVGDYSVSVYFHPLGRPSVATGVRVPPTRLRGRAAPSSGCATLNSAAQASRIYVTAPNVTSTLAKLTRIAHAEAAASGDATASGEAVHTTYGSAAEILGDGPSSSPAPSTPVWVVRLDGRFVCGSCSYPAGGRAPRGRHIVLVLLASGLRTTDLTLGNHSYDLSKLGTVVPLIP